jgi:hypothetical protein
MVFQVIDIKTGRHISEIDTIGLDSSHSWNLVATVVTASDNRSVTSCCTLCKVRETKLTPNNVQNDEFPILVYKNNSRILKKVLDRFTLPLRITCYCRHIKEKIGFKLLLRLREGENVLTETFSPPIMITDDHKTNKKRDLLRKDNLLNDDERKSIISIPAEIPIMPCIPRILTKHLSITNVIPPQGCSNGGNEVVLLGTNLPKDSVVYFGDNRAVDIVYHSSKMIICKAPAHIVPQDEVMSKALVPISIVTSEQSHLSLAMYSYQLDSKGLLELALQIIGFRMNGVLEDPPSVAVNIINQECSRDVELSKVLRSLLK